MPGPADYNISKLLTFITNKGKLPQSKRSMSEKKTEPGRTLLLIQLVSILTLISFIITTKLMQARVLAEEFLISLARRQILSLLSIITIDRASNLLVNLSLLVNKQEKCSNRMIYLVLMM